MIKLIGITGSAGAGKTTFANILQKELSEQHLIFSDILPFAYKLKQFAKELGWNGEKDDKGRRLLQLLGTEVARECISNDIWIKHWENEMYSRLIKSDYPKETFIIDDVRFPNEANYLKKHDGLIVRIDGRSYDNVDMNHASESELMRIQEDFTIVNNQGINNLTNFTKIIFKALQL